MPWVPNRRTVIGRLFEPTWQVNPQIERTLLETPPGARICDLGAGGRRVRPDAVCVDLEAGSGTDMVADIHEIPLPNDEFSLVICTGTLNLCRQPSKVIEEIYRILRPGGWVHVEAPMFQPYTPEPEDYWRWTRAGLRRLHESAGFEEIRSGVHIGPITAVAASAIHEVSQILEGNSFLRRAGRSAAHIFFGPLKYADALLSTELLDRSPLAYGLYYVGKKPVDPRVSATRHLSHR